MIKIVPHFMRVRNGESGEFVDYLVIKGAPGTIENLSYFSTNETGDSEELVMTQKGVTDIHEKLLSGETMVGSADSAFYAVYADRAENDTEGNSIITTYAKNAQIEGELFSEGNILEEAVRLIGDGTKSFIAHRYFTVTYDDLGNEDIKGLPAGVTRGYATFIVHNQSVTVWLWGDLDSRVHYNRYNGSSWTGWRQIVDSSNTNGLYVERATKDAKGNVIDTTYATKTALTDGTIVPKKATTATNADTATKVELSLEATQSDWLDVWFSRGADSTKPGYHQRARQGNSLFRYNPGTNTLRVGSITGNAATATKADKLNSDAFKTATATFTIASGKGTSMTGSMTPGFYLAQFRRSSGMINIGMSYFQSSGSYTISVGSYHIAITFTVNANGNADCTVTQLYYGNDDRNYDDGTLTFYKISS